MPFTSETIIDTSKKRSLIATSINTLQAKNAPIAFAVLDTATGAVAIYTKPNRSSGRSSWLRERVIDLPWRDPAEVNPLLTDAAQHDPVVRAHHDAQVRDMLIHLVSYYRPDLPGCPLFSVSTDAMVGSIHKFQDMLIKLPDTRTRWEAILSSFVSALDEPVSKPRPRTKRGKAKA
ncbi:hypothetical protein [Methylobacterium sp. yr668]|uniref:hypothetical protein n=1 Tax=Methylobacterium sp. yr668 TaxID=1761801 RepID=UPI0008E41036|nr:hypothetical protein [Methylobacterium sp. yr668]SFT21673.1 hypothetical protein SAMN04487845_12589 [Methylobacterium sp. yr668]